MSKVVKHGVNGTLTWSGTDQTIIYGIRGWTLDVSGETIEDTSIESTSNWTEKTASWREASVKVDVINAGADATYIAESGTLVLGDGTKTYTMTAICTGIGKTVNYKDATATTFNFKVNGAVTTT